MITLRIFTLCILLVQSVFIGSEVLRVVGNDEVTTQGHPHSRAWLSII